MVDLGTKAACLRISTVITQVSEMEHRLSTASLPVAQRLEFWRDIVNENFVRLRCELEPAYGLQKSVGLEASLNRSNISDISLLEVVAQPQSVTRLSNQRQPDEYFLFTLQLKGNLELHQDSRVATIKPGEMVLYDTRRPYKVSLKENFHKYTIRIPSDIMRLHIPNPERYVATPLGTDSFIGKLLGNLIYNCVDAPEGLEEKTQTVLANSIMSILVSALGSLAGSDDARPSKLGQFQIERIKHAIDANLSDSTFTVDRLASILRISPSSVHRAFDAEALTPSEYIWNKRIDACKHALSAATLSHLSIAEIAYSWGFTSNAHFSRAFKKNTGLTPREYRVKGAHTQK